MAEITNKRINFVLAVIFIFSGVILCRMFNWQVFKHPYYIALAEEQHSFLGQLLPERGEIYIRDKSNLKLVGDRKDSYFPVAVNNPGYAVYAVPKNIKDIAGTVKSLEEPLGISAEILTKSLSKPNDSYEVLAHKVSAETIKKIEGLNLEGIMSEEETWRYWPENNFMSHVLGFVGFSGSKRVGQYGLEGYYNSKLEGESGVIETEQAVGGKWISFGMKQYVPAQNGVDLVLTIDRSIQYKIEQVLDKKAQEIKAKSASAIVMDPSTGRILAMASWPNFDLNNYSAVKNYNIFLNNNIQSRYEPGSVIKSFTMAAALNEGKITPETKYEDKGKMIINGWPVSNAENKVYGVQTMTQVLENSINTGAIFAYTKIGKDKFLEYFKNFGFDVPTGVELQGEISGDLSNLDDKKDVNYANASFGQGVAMTPLEVITAFSSLVNGGKLMKPYIVEKVMAGDKVIEEHDPEIVRQIISEATSAKISSMMVSVVEYGHSKGAKINGYWIGGKTGTAQAPFENKKGYSDKTIHTFVGFGSAPDPKFVVLIKFDEPETVPYADYSATPAFNEIAKFLVNYLEIPPNRK
jgi:cell division protein FtsI (penicillin-binding protein 3)/stage V sporulation protein D (sporulation-specific penicillin-binding protein)